MDRTGCRRPLLLVLRARGSVPALGHHAYLAVFLALATAFTVFIISYAYSRIIERFPHGGGGYIVATHTLGERAGVVSGCALLVDYMLTITVSLVSCADALFSFLPQRFHAYKLGFVALLIVLLVVINLRGVKESILLLAPIFIVFVATHMLLLGYGILSHTDEIGPVVQGVRSMMREDLATVGALGVLAIFLRAYSMGAGTYTGIEAVSNGLQIMREPKVQTGKRTMAYMASSLAVTASGLFLCYLLWRVVPAEGKTLNAILATSMFGHWPAEISLRWSPSSRKARSCLSPRRRDSSMGPGSWQTWPSMRGCRGAFRPSPNALPCGTALCSWVLRQSFSLRTPAAPYRPW